MDEVRESERVLRAAGGGVVLLDEQVRRSVVRALAGEPLPAMLRKALVELGAAEYRSAVAAQRYRARALASISDPEEREVELASCIGWPEFVERREARENLRAVSERTAVLARAWVEVGAERVEVSDGEPFFVGSAS